MPKKFLTVCEGGVVRSGAMAFRLKDAGQDAIQCSWKWNTPETFRMLLDWCDYVILMQGYFIDKVPGIKDYPKKIITIDVGPDVYGNPLHMGLNLGLKNIVDEWAAKGFELG